MIHCHNIIKTHAKTRVLGLLLFRCPCVSLGRPSPSQYPLLPRCETITDHSTGANWRVVVTRLRLSVRRWTLQKRWRICLCGDDHEHDQPGVVNADRLRISPSMISVREYINVKRRSELIMYVKITRATMWVAIFVGQVGMFGESKIGRSSAAWKWNANQGFGIA